MALPELRPHLYWHDRAQSLSPLRQARRLVRKGIGNVWERLGTSGLRPEPRQEAVPPAPPLSRGRFASPGFFAPALPSGCLPWVERRDSAPNPGRRQCLLHLRFPGAASRPRDFSRLRFLRAAYLGWNVGAPPRTLAGGSVSCTSAFPGPLRVPGIFRACASFGLLHLGWNVGTPHRTPAGGSALLHLRFPGPLRVPGIFRACASFGLLTLGGTSGLRPEPRQEAVPPAPPLSRGRFASPVFCACASFGLLTLRGTSGLRTSISPGFFVRFHRAVK